MCIEDDPCKDCTVSEPSTTRGLLCSIPTSNKKKEVSEPSTTRGLLCLCTREIKKDTVSEPSTTRGLLCIMFKQQMVIAVSEPSTTRGLLCLKSSTSFSSLGLRTLNYERAIVLTEYNILYLLSNQIQKTDLFACN